MLWDTGPVAAARVSPRPTMPGVTYDPVLAETAVQFFPRYCRHTAGTGKALGKISAFAGRPFHLHPVQQWIIRNAFGWLRADGTRLYRRVIIWVPRKNGKTELLAGVSHLSMTALGVAGAEVYSIAATADQAALVFRAAQAMVSYSEQLAAEYELLKNSIYCPALHTAFRPLSGKAAGKHGLKCYVMIGDEAHEWRDGELHQYVRQSMGAWADPMEWIISTAGKPEGYGHELWDQSVEIVEGVVDDPETLVIIFAADKEDDIADPAIWAKANPLLGVSIGRDYIETEVRRALKTPSLLPFVKRYHFNIWAEDSAQRWIAPDVWAGTAGSDAYAWRSFEERLAGRICYGGLDLAATRDTNALVWLFPPAGDDDKWVLLPRFWWPREQAEAQRSLARLPIEMWEQTGAITLTPGNVADHDAIERQIREDCDRFRVMHLGVDPMFAFRIIQNLLTDSIPVIEVKPTMVTMSLPSTHFERMATAGEFDHGNHPVLRWQIGSTSIKTGDHGAFMQCINSR
jgi:phage terminase large subunit-like protein